MELEETVNSDLLNSGDDELDEETDWSFFWRSS